ncbi:MAG: DUF1697 domain-containing protein [Bacteroidota bacterium]
METYIALLRGINVSGQKRILMADLRLLFESLGLVDVRTYIQSGNVLFKTSEGNGLAEKIAKAIEVKYGWKVLILVKTASELVKIVEKCPFSDEKKQKSYFVLLDQPPSEDRIRATQELSHQNEEFQITSNCVYIFYAEGAGKAKWGNNWFERKLKVNATARNYRTLRKLIEMTLV